MAKGGLPEKHFTANKKKLFTLSRGDSEEGVVDDDGGDDE
jgi:hypothetical protein